MSGWKTTIANDTLGQLQARTWPKDKGKKFWNSKSNEKEGKDGERDFFTGEHETGCVTQEPYIYWRYQVTTDESDEIYMRNESMIWARIAGRADLSTK